MRGVRDELSLLSDDEGVSGLKGTHYQTSAVPEKPASILSYKALVCIQVHIFFVICKIFCQQFRLQMNETRETNNLTGQELKLINLSPTGILR